MTMSDVAATSIETRAVGALQVLPLPHPQGCRTYLVGDGKSKEALAIDPHLDLVDKAAAQAEAEGWTLRYVVDTHTHADHPSGSAALAEKFGAVRVAHELASHAGVTLHPEDGDVLPLGDATVVVRHAPGHTPDHMVLLGEGMVFSGDSLFIGGVARTDFLGGDAGVLFDTLQAVFADLPDEAVLYPGHDYNRLIESTMGAERKTNPWLRMTDRDEFVKNLTANPPPEPANMHDLLRLNREGVAIPASVPAALAVERVEAGGAGSVIDVRTDIEFQAEKIPGSRHVPLDQVAGRADEIRATPAPRLLLCRTANRAEQARAILDRLEVSGLSVIEGGIQAYHCAGGRTVSGEAVMSLERQVRVVAGILVVLGVALGFLVHPAFFGLSAFIGAGQVFAGITDRCGMGMAIAKMPWNRRTKSATGTDEFGGCSATLPPGGCSATLPEEPSAGGCAATPPGE
jgi:glyoxylase-like metal-dependent hydrolase (beta-lactamase superfamily II)